LSIIHCARFSDAALVKQLWDKIICEEIKDTQALKEKILSLGREFYPSELVFPVEYLVDVLERSNFQSVQSGEWLIQTMHDIGVPFPTLLEYYDDIFDTKDTFWQSPEAQIHLVKAIITLLTEWVNSTYQFQSLSPSQVSLPLSLPTASVSSNQLYDKHQLASKHIDALINKYIVILQSFRNTQTLQAQLKSLSSSIRSIISEFLF